MVTKDDFLEWKNHPVTQAFYEAANIRIDDTKEILSETAGINPDDDNFYRGFIKAYRELLDLSVEDVE